MNRMNIIQFINPGWYKQLVDFLKEHPAFEKLLPIVALDEYPCGFNKNPHESEPNAPLNIFETILWGISHAGVDMKYGDKQYLQMLKYMREVPYFTQNMEFPFEVQEKKIKTYRSLINMCLERNISPPELTLEHMSFVEYVEDIADSTIVYVYMLYGSLDDPNVIPHADEYFNKGIEMFYGIPNPTRQQIKSITDTWSNKKVGLMFITQYAHYSSYIKEDNNIEVLSKKEQINISNEDQNNINSKIKDEENINNIITNIIEEITSQEIIKKKQRYSTIPITIPGPNPITVFMTVTEELIPHTLINQSVSDNINITKNEINTTEIISNINNIFNNITNNSNNISVNNEDNRKKNRKSKEPKKVKEPKEPKKVKEPKEPKKVKESKKLKKTELSQEFI